MPVCNTITLIRTDVTCARSRMSPMMIIIISVLGPEEKERCNRANSHLHSYFEVGSVVVPNLGMQRTASADPSIEYILSDPPDIDVVGQCKPNEAGDVRR